MQLRTGIAIFAVLFAILAALGRTSAPVGFAADRVADAGAVAQLVAGFEAPLTQTPGDAARGREIVFARDRGNCVVCHAIPGPDMAYDGNLGPSLAGIAAKRTPAELRLRLVDSRLLNPKTLMPPYHVPTDGLVRVAKRYAGKPVLTAQDVEDVLAFLMTLRE